jgi:transposase-like protein
MAEISYRRHRFPPAIIQHAVWLYLRFTLSYRDVEELLAERGARHLLRNRPVLGAEIRTGERATAAPTPSAAEQSLEPRRNGGADRRWRMYLWRAIDHEGEVLDMLVQRRRDTRAALRLMLLKKQGFGPKLLVTDKLRSYARSGVCD